MGQTHSPGLPSAAHVGLCPSCLPGFHAWLPSGLGSDQNAHSSRDSFFLIFSVASLQFSAFILPAEMLLTVPSFIRLIKLGFLVLGAPGGQSTPHPIHQVPNEAPEVPASVPCSLGLIKARPLACTLGLPAAQPGSAPGPTVTQDLYEAPRHEAPLLAVPHPHTVPRSHVCGQKCGC